MLPGCFCLDDFAWLGEFTGGFSSSCASGTEIEVGSFESSCDTLSGSRHETPDVQTNIMSRIGSSS